MKKSPRKSWSCSKPGDFLSPPGSTRYLLSGKELLSAFDLPPLNLFPPQIPNSSKDEDEVAVEDEDEDEREKPDQVPFLSFSFLMCMLIISDLLADFQPL